MTWKVRPESHFRTARAHSWWNKRFSCKAAGYIKERPKQTDYCYLKLVDRHVLAHRVVWALTQRVDLSEVPRFLDHKNGDPLDNRPSNLRPATHRQNQYNRANRTNKHGLRGVRFHPERGYWSASINTPEKKLYIGTFGSKEEAAAAYIGAAKILHGEFFRECSEPTQAAA